MDTIKNGWFTEESVMWPGQAFSLEVDKVLFHEKSKFQDVMVLKSKQHGNVLLLDGLIQVTERDEFSYSEMFAHVPVNCHPKPSKVLVVGGGDGGVVRELVKHPAVDSVTMCEIDEMVVDASKKHLHCMASGFGHAKLNLLFEDGFLFMGKHAGEFDVIITDSSDPVGPAPLLFEKPYYELMKKALKPGGIICSQGDCLWLDLPDIKKTLEFCRELYPVVDYGYCAVPTYPSGQIGFIMCSLNPNTNFREPVRILTEKQMENMKLKYYHPDIHRASFQLPLYMKKTLA